jgi:hypothetical protein
VDGVALARHATRWQGRDERGVIVYGIRDDVIVSGRLERAWPQPLPSFRRGLQAWHEQTHIGYERMPEWLVRATGVFMVFAGVVTVVATMTSLP